MFSFLAVAEAAAERPRLVDQNRLAAPAIRAGVMRSVGPVMLSAATTSPRGAADRRGDRREPRLELVDRGRVLVTPDDLELGRETVAGR